jgi:hypothetical protein
MIGHATIYAVPEFETVIARRQRRFRILCGTIIFDFLAAGLASSLTHVSSFIVWRILANKIN